MSPKIYSHDDKEIMARAIEKLDREEHFLAIFKIIMEEPQKNCIANSNGILLNLSKVSSGTLDKIQNYLDTIPKKKKKTIRTAKIVKPKEIQSTERVFKRSNYENKILKRHEEEPQYTKFTVGSLTQE
jgi:hypothetical protein